MVPDSKTIYALAYPRTQAVFYVGASVEPIGRLKQHLIDSRNRRNLPLHGALREIQANGDAPALIILETVPVAEWEAAEIKWIAKYRNEGAPLLNATVGGVGLVGPNDATREKIAATLRARTEKSAFFGHKHSESSKALISAANKGRTNFWKGKHRPEQPQRRKSYILISPDGKEMETSNLPAFCRERDLSPHNLRGVLTGRVKHHKGWRIRYPDIQ